MFLMSQTRWLVNDELLATHHLEYILEQVYEDMEQVPDVETIPGDGGGVQSTLSALFIALFFLS